MTKERLFNWRFWLQWILATTLGWLLGGAIFPIEIGAGAAIGFLQWLVLRPFFYQTWWWIAYSAVGWILGWGVLLILPSSTVFSGVILGLSMGIAQWIPLRKWVPQAFWWPLVSALAWMIGFGEVMFGETLIGAIVGVITGITLELFIRFSK